MGSSQKIISCNGVLCCVATEQYYQDAVTVTVKGLEMELVKILTLFTSIDISNNQFSGEIPSTIDRLKALYVLNVSHKEFTGSITPYVSFNLKFVIQSIDRKNPNRQPTSDF